MYPVAGISKLYCYTPNRQDGGDFQKVYPLGVAAIPRANASNTTPPLRAFDSHVSDEGMRGFPRAALQCTEIASQCPCSTTERANFKNINRNPTPKYACQSTTLEGEGLSEAKTVKRPRKLTDSWDFAILFSRTQNPSCLSVSARAKRNRLSLCSRERSLRSLLAF